MKRGRITLFFILIGLIFLAYGYLRWASIIKLTQSGTSMLPSIMPGDIVAVDRKAYWLNQPKRFDLVAFRYFNHSNAVVIFRVVGLPGETIQLQTGTVTVGGKVLQLPDNVRTIPVSVGAFGSTNTYTIPKRHYYLLGDNGTNASDSRFWGPVKRENVIGKAYILTDDKLSKTVAP
jgi:signal peptidase I